MRRLRSAAALAVLLAFAAPAGGRAEAVKEIRVENRGAGLADEASVKAFTSIRVGDEFNRAAVGRDIKSLQKSGRFSYVSALADTTPGGWVVTYIVESKPRIARMEVVGADYVGNKKVRELLELGVADVVDDALLAVRSQKVVETYQKKYFPDVKVFWDIEPAAEAGNVNVTVTVKEGKRANVKRIRFTGNEHVKAGALLKVMKQRRVNWLSWITGAGVYNPDDLEGDVETLRRAYMDRGYLDAAIGEPQVKPIAKRSLEVTIPVQEGKAYRVRGVSVSGVTLFPQGDVEATLKIKPRDIASLGAVEKGSQSVRDFFGSRGHIRTVVDYDIDVDSAKSLADVSYSVKEGRLAYIRNIAIRGNSVTKDKVIRRELAVYPGEIFNEVKVRTSERRLQNLGYFSYVGSMPETTPEPDQYDLAFEVEEQKTGQFMIGAGFSSVDDLIGFVELSQGNFDLFNWPYFVGGGQKLKLRTQFGTKRTDYEISFVEPWFLNRRLSLGVDFYSHDYRFLSDEYDQRTIGGDISLGKPLGAFNRITLTYGLEQIDIDNVSTNASDLIKQEEGLRTKSSLTLELSHDTRDAVFVPTRGNRSSVSSMLAGGPLGANTDIYGFQTRTAQYWPLWFDHVFNIRGWAAMVDRYGDSERVPIFDRLFLGGPRTIRGFAFHDVGPKDDTGEPVGGRAAVCFNAEYTIPVAEKVRIAAYYDAGVVWQDLFSKGGEEPPLVGDGMYNSAIGVGLRLDFPGFPIQLDYAWPIDADEYNDRPNGRFSFWLGYPF